MNNLGITLCTLENCGFVKKYKHLDFIRNIFSGLVQIWGVGGSIILDIILLSAYFSNWYMRRPQTLFSWQSFPTGPFLGRFPREKWSFSISDSSIWRVTTCAATILWTCTVATPMVSASGASVVPSGREPWCPVATRWWCRWFLMPTQLGMASWPCSRPLNQMKEVLFLYNGSRAAHSYWVPTVCQALF